MIAGLAVSGWKYQFVLGEELDTTTVEWGCRAQYLQKYEEQSSGQLPADPYHPAEPPAGDIYEEGYRTPYCNSLLAHTQSITMKFTISKNWKFCHHIVLKLYDKRWCYQNWQFLFTIIVWKRAEAYSEKHDYEMKLLSSFTPTRIHLLIVNLIFICAIFWGWLYLVKLKLFFTKECRLLQTTASFECFFPSSHYS